VRVLQLKQQPRSTDEVADGVEGASLAGIADAWRLEDVTPDGPRREGLRIKVLLVVGLLVKKERHASVNGLPPVVLLHTTHFPGQPDQEEVVVVVG